MKKGKLSRIRLKSIVLTCVLITVCLCSFASDSQTNIWESVKARAKAEGKGKKAIWHELKQLSPAELLACGQELYAAEGSRSGRNAIIANAILSYHSNKTSPKSTAIAISRILRSSENPEWLKECVMWIENNNHFLDIPPEAMRKMGVAVSDSIRGKTDQSMAAREAMLDAAREDTFIMCLPEDSFELVRNACRDLLADGSSVTASKRLYSLASEYLDYASEGEKHRDEWNQHVKNLRAKRKKNRMSGDDGLQ